MGVYLRVDVPIVPITTAGIYHNPDSGIISISADGTNWTTIADKNLGATVVYNDGDTLDGTNCGNYFQWGNCYGFPFTGPVSTSSTSVDVSSYGPGNYYSNSTYRTISNGWIQSQNADLWGGQTDTNSSKQGPCDSGYHIPSANEWNALNTLGVTIGAWTSGVGEGIKDYLFMPYAGQFSSSGTLANQGIVGDYWTATSTSTKFSGLIIFNDSTNNYNSGRNVSGAAPIRPFKNEAVQPDDRWTVLYQ